MNKPHHPIRFEQIDAAGRSLLDGSAVIETPVGLTVNGAPWLTLMCTPVDLEALAIGFLFNEGLIQSMQEVADARVCEHGDNVDVWLTHAVEQPARWRRTSGCTGGVTAVEEDLPPAALPLNGVTLTPSQVWSLASQLFASQTLYRQSGGVHTSALGDGERLLVAAEDIGRHNTLDKIAGLLLMRDLRPARRILATTGRISSEMLQKAARIGAAVVISRTAPSSLSLQMAERRGITVIGYVKPERFNIYTHPERIVSVEKVKPA